MNPKISVLIPMYNEEENVVNTVKKVSETVYNLNVESEILIVNAKTKRNK